MTPASKTDPRPSGRHQRDRDDHLQYLLTAYLFGDLSAAGREEVESHLEECARCREELADLRAMVSLTEEAVHADQQDYVFDDRRRARVLVAARRTRFGFLSKLGLPQLSRFHWSFVSLAALLLVLLTGGLILFSFSSVRYSAYDRETAARYSENSRAMLKTDSLDKHAAAKEAPTAGLDYDYAAPTPADPMPQGTVTEDFAKLPPAKRRAPTPEPVKPTGESSAAREGKEEGAPLPIQVPKPVFIGTPKAKPPGVRLEPPESKGRRTAETAKPSEPGLVVGDRPGSGRKVAPKPSKPMTAPTTPPPPPMNQPDASRIAKGPGLDVAGKGSVREELRRKSESDRPARDPKSEDRADKAIGLEPGLKDGPSSGGAVYRPGDGRRRDFYDQKQPRDVFKNSVVSPEDLPPVEHPVVTHEEVEVTDHNETADDMDNASAKGDSVDSIADVPLGGVGFVSSIGLGGGGKKRLEKDAESNRDANGKLALDGTKVAPEKEKTAREEKLKGALHATKGLKTVAEARELRERLGPGAGLSDKQVADEADREMSRLQKWAREDKKATPEERSKVDERMSKLQEKKDAALRRSLEYTSRTAENKYKNTRGEAAARYYDDEDKVNINSAENLSKQLDHLAKISGEAKSGARFEYGNGEPAQDKDRLNSLVEQQKEPAIHDVSDLTLSLKRLPGPATHELGAGERAQAGKDAQVRRYQQGQGQQQGGGQGELRIASQLDQTKELLEVGEYERAEELAGRILKADPTNEQARQVQAVAADRKDIKRQKWIQEEPDEQAGQQKELGQGVKLNEQGRSSAEGVSKLKKLYSGKVAPPAQLAHADFLLYPYDWEAIAKRTDRMAIGRTVREEQWKLDIRKKMQRKVSFEFADTPLEEAVSFLKSLTNVPIVVDPTIDTTKLPPIGLRATDMNTDTALKWIVRSSGLDYEIRDGAIHIVPLSSIAASPDQSERLVRSFRYFQAENKRLDVDEFLRRPVPIPAPVPTDEGMDEDAFIQKYGIRPFVDAASDNLSTFGLDVDTASFTRARALLQQGQLPPPETVRTEEFVNYFKQDYRVEGDETFGVFVDGMPSVFGATGMELVKIGIKSREPRADERKPTALTFVVDVSGSMARADNVGRERVHLIRHALSKLVKALQPEDSVCLVTFSDQARLALPRTQARYANRILDALDRLAPGGATNVEAGLEMGYRMADEAYSPDHINRVILCSDGVANVGAKGPEPMLKLVKTFAGRGIDLNTVGFGTGAKYDDRVMQELANRGNGACHYVDSEKEAERIFLEQLPANLDALARDAKAQVEFDPTVVKRYRLLGYEKRKIADADFRNDKIDSGEIGHATLVTAIYEIERHPGAHGALGKIFLRWKDAALPHRPVVERNYALSEGLIASSREAADANLRFLACVAEFAELMRHSRWARDGSYAAVLEELNRLPDEIRARPEWSEVRALVWQAHVLSMRKWLEGLKR